MGDNREVYVTKSTTQTHESALRRTFSVMIWGCIYFQGVGPITDVQDNIIIDNDIWSAIAMYFPENKLSSWTTIPLFIMGTL